MIVLLLCIGALLVFLNIKALNKEKKSFSNAYHYAEENMEEFEVSLVELRREFSETILELQKEIQEIKKNIENSNETNTIKVYNNTEGKFTERTIEIEKTEGKEIIDKINEEKNTKSNNSVKIDEINKLLSQGFSIEEIGSKLSIGKGEVLLIKELYLK